MRRGRGCAVPCREATQSGARVRRVRHGDSPERRRSGDRGAHPGARLTHPDEIILIWQRGRDRGVALILSHS